MFIIITILPNYYPAYTLSMPGTLKTLKFLQIYRFEGNDAFSCVRVWQAHPHAYTRCACRRIPCVWHKPNDAFRLEFNMNLSARMIARCLQSGPRMTKNTTTSNPTTVASLRADDYLIWFCLSSNLLIFCFFFHGDWQVHVYQLVNCIIQNFTKDNNKLIVDNCHAEAGKDNDHEDIAWS